MRASVVVNDRAGSVHGAGLNGRLRELFASSGVEARLTTPSAAELAEGRVAGLDDADFVVAAGGDGTVSAVARLAIARELPLAVLPLGTLNHFARDVGIPLALEKAVAVAARGRVLSIDVGEANGRVFVNNSSIGLYPDLVKKREQRRSRLGKWPAMLVAVLSVVRRLPQTRVRLRARGSGFDRVTPIVFVGNNRYESIRRERLDEGVLAVYVAEVRSAAGLFRLALRGLLGRLDQAADLELHCVPELTIESRRPSMRVAFDGEIERLATPLEYRIRSRALGVVVPPGGDALGG